MDAVSGRRAGRRAFDKAPHAPIAGASTVAMYNEKLHVVLRFLSDGIALHVMDVFPELCRVIRVRTENPQEVWGPLCKSRIGAFCPPVHPDG